MRFADWSLRAKLISAFLFIALVPLGVQGYLSYTNLKVSLERQVNQALLDNAIHIAKSVDSFIIRSLSSIARMADASSLVEYLNLPSGKREGSHQEAIAMHTLKALSQVMEAKPYTTSIALLDSHGRNLMDTAADRVGRNESSEIYFQQARKSPEPYLSPLQFTSKPGESILVLSRAVYGRNEQFKGVLRVEMDGVVLVSLLMGDWEITGEGSFSMLVDENYICLAHTYRSAPAHQCLRPLDPAVAKELRKARRLPPGPLRQAEGSLLDLRGVARQDPDENPYHILKGPDRADQLNSAAVAKTRTVPWLVVVSEPQAAFLAPVVRQARHMLYLVAAIVGIVIIGGFLLARLMAEPVKRLTSAATAMAQGDLAQPIEIDRGDEIGKLAQAFASMRDSLRDQIASLNQEVQRRKQAQEALAQSEATLRAILNAAPVGIALMQDRRAAWINPAVVRQIGYEAEELLAMDAKLLYPSEEEYLRVGRDLYGDESSPGLAETEATMVRKDGQLIQAQLVVGPVDPSDPSKGDIMVAMDITDRRQAQERLRLSEEKFHTLFDNVGDAIFMFDIQANILEANQEACKRLGYTHEEFLGMSAQDIDPRSTPERIEQITQELNRTRRFFLETVQVSKDGRQIPSEVVGRLVEFDGQMTVLAIIRDITQRKEAQQALVESEARLWAILRTNPNPMVVYDNQGRALYFNPAFSNVFGWELDELRGQRIPFVPPDQKEKARHFIRELFQTGLPVALETKRVTKDGQLREVFLAAASIKDRQGKVSEMVVNLTDITDRKKLEAQLLQSQKIEALGTLAGGVAHDFNNILQAITGYLELAMDHQSEQDSEVLNYLQEISHAAGRASDLVRRLLTFSRRTELDMRPVDLNQEVRSIIKVLERTIPKMIKIETRLDQDLSLTMGDPSQLEQVLMNLGTNARDAMPDGGQLLFETENVNLGQEYTRTNPELRPGQYILLKVSDTGRGMSRHERERIFEPFFTTKGVGKGTGLGLSTVYGVVKGHGGHVTCYSEVGTGTVFNIYLPVYKTDQPGPEEAQQEREDLSGGDETILLVDDEEAIKLVGREMMVSRGYRVILASSGEEALEIYQARGREIDLVILDLGMPGMGGAKCLSRLQEIDPQVLVLVSSGYSVNGQAKEVLDSSAVGFIAKPYRFNQMLKMVREVLDSRKAGQA